MPGPEQRAEGAFEAAGGEAGGKQQAGFGELQRQGHGRSVLR